MEITRHKTLIGERYLSFDLMSEVYCISIKRVKEIMGISEITPIPQVPSYIKGVINLRGQIIPIIDLRLKLGMPFKDYSKRTSVIIVELVLSPESETILVGMAVDTINEVIRIAPDKVSALSYLTSTIKSEFITGVAYLDDGMKIMLDVEKILNDTELGILDTAGSASR